MVCIQTPRGGAFVHVCAIEQHRQSFGAHKPKSRGCKSYHNAYISSCTFIQFKAGSTGSCWFLQYMRHTLLDPLHIRRSIRQYRICRVAKYGDVAAAINWKICYSAIHHLLAVERNKPAKQINDLRTRQPPKQNCGMAVAFQKVGCRSATM